MKAQKHWGFPNGAVSQDFHDFLMRALEVGWRVAFAEDGERLGYGPLFDLMVDEDPLMRETTS